jgi:hypothetical protein
MVLSIMLAFIMSQGSDAPVIRELKQIEQQLAATWQDGDCSAWGSMLSPGWSVIHITGDVITKERALDMCKAPRAAPVSIRIDDLAVRVFEGAAVVTGRTTARTSESKSAAVTLRFTDVFVRSAGRWQVVASQATQLSSTAAR